MMWGGVGRSGSPMPNEMTSMPCAFFAATFLLICAKRYGGSFSMRSANLMASSLLVRGYVSLVANEAGGY